MILILNYLPAFIVMIGLYVVYRYWKSPVPFTPEQRITRIILTVLITVCSVIILNSATPHYMPKHKITRSSIPEVQAVEGEIKNLQPQPVSGEERDKKRSEDYSDRIQFIKEREEK